MDRRATSGAEVIGNLAARIADANKHIRSAANLNALRGEPSLRTKNAASSALTRKAMTHGDANWIARRLHGELTAATGSCASGRWHVIVLSRRHFFGPRSTTWVAFWDAANCTHSYPRARRSTPSNNRSPRPSRTGAIA